MDKKEWKQSKKAFKKAKHRAIRPWKGMSIFSAIFAIVYRDFCILFYVRQYISC